MAKTVFHHVSDTARWVAEYRAQESARPDALFHDPLAAGLAGERGRIIAEAAKRSFGNGWFFIARTKLIDDLVERSLAEGCDRVVNLAAGLDTRPYRLEVPPSLEWIEVDLPVIIEEKNRVLADESPRCKLSRVPLDLTDAAARRGCLTDAVKGAAKTLVITEGLLLYLPESEVRELTTELNRPEIAWWVADIIGPTILKMSSKPGRRNNAPVIFGPENGIAFFERAGWTVDRFASQLPAAAQWNRLSAAMRIVARLPKGNPRRPGRSLWSAVLRLTP
ncbi:class I SAM-dependent methyltransferase [Streptomyces coffeae]|uniref:S-adenosyl-L-methionine-dependent methyltransferase n=1 Tax=Streptomyces coffeae TaxID=621382 RepID=A0ABS1NBH7_9ACTN|nr:SAM-dependent methyltransferase [Streptomyces coffeae]MBL1097430.1 SAM-dependent methyltransferase [Streptomyces coffeae]